MNIDRDLHSALTYILLEYLYIRLPLIYVMVIGLLIKMRWKPRCLQFESGMPWKRQHSGMGNTLQQGWVTQWSTIVVICGFLKKDMSGWLGMREWIVKERPCRDANTSNHLNHLLGAGKVRDLLDRDNSVHRYGGAGVDQEELIGALNLGAFC